MLAKLFCTAAVLTSGIGGFAQMATTAPLPKRPIIIIVTIDGLPARVLREDLPMPTLLSMAQTGAVAEGMIPINPTVTWPNHTTLITGVDASQHHVMANGLLEVSPEKIQVTVRPEARESIYVIHMLIVLLHLGACLHVLPALANGADHSCSVPR